MMNGVSVHPAMAEYVSSAMAGSIGEYVSAPLHEYVPSAMGEYVAGNGMGGVGIGTAAILAWGGLFAGAYIGYKYSKKWRVAKAIGLGLLGNYAGAVIGASFAVPDSQVTG